MTRLAWLVVGVGLTHATLALCGEKSAARSDKEIKALIDQLVSPNPKPITGDDDPKEAPEYRLPPGFDRKKQEPVRAARHELRQLGPRAFPFLIERWGDQRYCMTVSHGLSGYCHNQTVGDLCRAIVFDQLQPYSYWPKVDDDPRGKPKRPSYPGQFLGSQKAARRWWDKNKDKSLHEMQREALDWVMAEEAKTPSQFTKQERRHLDDIRKQLRHGPLPPGNYDTVDVEQ